MTQLTLIPSPSSGSVDVAITDAPRAATNLAPNPSFELADISAWSAYGAGTAIGRSQARFSATDGGTSSLVITTGTDVLVGAQTSVPVTPGKRYGIRLEAFLNNGADIRLRVIYRDAGGAQLTSQDHSLPGTPGATWTTLQVDAGAAPANAARVWIYFQRYSAAVSGQFIYLDCVTVQELAAGESFTGRYMATSRSGDVTVTRTDANGTDVAVRGFAGWQPVNGALTKTDYELAMTGQVTYKVTDSAGQVTTATTTLAMAGAPARIAPITAPSSVVVPKYVTGYEAAAESATVVHWAVDRSDPIVLMRPARTRQGTLTLWASSHAEAVTLWRVVRPGQLLRLRQADHTGMDMSFAVLGSTVEPAELNAAGWAWQLRADYVEVVA